MRFAHWLCDCGQRIALSGPPSSHAGPELMGEKLHLASGSRTALSSGRNRAWPGMNALALAALGPVWRRLGSLPLPQQGQLG